MIIAAYQSIAQRMRALGDMCEHMCLHGRVTQGDPRTQNLVCTQVFNEASKKRAENDRIVAKKLYAKAAHLFASLSGPESQYSQLAVKNCIGCGVGNYY